jgi:predicted nuclease of predicted toxin-antitoxin system
MENDLVKDLRRRGHDCETATEAGMLTQPDERVIDYATDANRVVVTANQGDFMRISGSILRDGRSHPGIIIMAQ